MPDQLKWDTRLTVVVGGVAVTPIDSIVWNVNSPVQPLHSLEANNVAHIVQPETFTFTMSVKAIGTAVAKLVKLAQEHTSFTLSVSEATGNDWTFNSVDFHDCYITSVANNTVIDGVPTTTFNCICLDLSPTAAP